MTDMKDGGPAFPNTEVYHPHDGSGMWQGADGMSLRDWFAGMALQGYSSNQEHLDTHTHEETAELAYIAADAMLAKRDRDPVDELALAAIDAEAQRKDLTGGGDA